jgi:hypothetical protein
MNPYESPFANPHLQKEMSGTFTFFAGEDHECLQASPPALSPRPSSSLAKAFNIIQLRDALDDIAETYVSHVSQRKFKREAGAAWQRKAPTDIPVTPQNMYQAFIKNNIASIRNDNPELSHQQHMRIIGNMWNESKKSRFHSEASTSASASVSMSMSKNVTGVKRQADEM